MPIKEGCCEALSCYSGEYDTVVDNAALSHTKTPLMHSSVSEQGVAEIWTSFFK